MARKPSFLARLIRRLCFLVLLIAVVLVFMYSERVGRYPWKWQEDDLPGFLDYCLLKYDEAREGTVALVARFEDSELRARLDGLYDKLNEKLRSRRKRQPQAASADEQPERPAEEPAPAPASQPPSAPAPTDPPPEEPAPPPPGPTAAPVPRTPKPDPAPPPVEAAQPAEPELSEAERLWLEGYELKQRGHASEGKAAEELFLQAVDVWKKQAVPALEREIEAAENTGERDRARELEELYQSLNVLLHDLFKDRPM